MSHQRTSARRKKNKKPWDPVPIPKQKKNKSNRHRHRKKNIAKEAKDRTAARMPAPRLLALPPKDGKPLSQSERKIRRERRKKGADHPSEEMKQHHSAPKQKRPESKTKQRQHRNFHNIFLSAKSAEKSAARTLGAFIIHKSRDLPLDIHLAAIEKQLGHTKPLALHG